MIYTGMIFQYDSDNRAGLLMLSDGEKKEFNITQWTDEENQPKVGQKISYKKLQNRVEIRVATTEDEETAKLSQEEQNELEELNEIDEPNATTPKSVEEYKSYFLSLGYKLVKDTYEGEMRVVSLRMYTAQEYGEAMIKESANKISVTQSLNGKTVLNT